LFLHGHFQRRGFALLIVIASRATATREKAFPRHK
jgi:hypothetical protein